MKNPKLSILIATIGPRWKLFSELMACLMPRAGEHDIEVIGYWNCGDESIGEIRQALLEEARGNYVCFIDDDDMVPDYYCDEIMAALGEDYVGFRVELFESGKQMKPVFHSLKYDRWYEDQQAYYRGVTHLNPIRREIALQGTFHKNGIGEDVSWAKSIESIPKTENYIDKVMYYYNHDRENTTFGGVVKDAVPHTRPTIAHPQFRWHPNSKEKGTM